MLQLRLGFIAHNYRLIVSCNVIQYYVNVLYLEIISCLLLSAERRIGRLSTNHQCKCTLQPTALLHYEHSVHTLCCSLEFENERRLLGKQSNNRIWRLHPCCLFHWNWTPIVVHQYHWNRQRMSGLALLRLRSTDVGLRPHLCILCENIVSNSFKITRTRTELFHIRCWYAFSK